MATWNRNVTSTDGSLVLSKPSQNANPPDHANDPVNEMNVAANDFANGGKVQMLFHAVDPANTTVALTGIASDTTSDPQKCTGDITKLTATVTGNGNLLTVEVPSTAPHATYCFLIKADVTAGGSTTHQETPDPMIHNQTSGGPLPR